MALGSLVQAILPHSSVVTSVVAGAVAGVLASVAMVLPMSRQPEGFTPAYVAAAVLHRTTPDEVRFLDANVTHYGTGALAGVLYAVVFVTLGSLIPPLVRIDGVTLVPHVIAVGFVVLFIYAFFAHFVLPRTGGRIYEEQATAVRGQWLRSSLVFGAVLVVVGPVLVSLAA